MIYLILVFGLILRLVALNQSLWLDEATSALVVRNFSLGEIITKFAPGDFHPPLYYLFLKLWADIFGTSEIALRLPSVVFGLATIYGVYLLGKELFKKKVGLIASLLLATSGLNIYYSQEARMYSLIALLVSLLVYCFLNKSWFWFSILLVLVAATDYPALLIIPVFWLLGKKDWKELAISHLPWAALFPAWLPIFSKQLASGLGVSSLAPKWWLVLGKTNLKELLLIPTKFILGRITFDNKNIYALVVLVACSIFGYLIIRSFKNRKSLLVWLWLLIPIVGTAVLGFKVSIFSYFRLIFVLPAFYLLVASGISAIKRPWWKWALILVLSINVLSSLTYLINPRFHRENWMGLVKFVESQKTSQSITLFVADSNMEAYQYYAPDAKIAGPEALNKAGDEIWLMRYVQEVFDPEDKLRTKIEKSGYLKKGEFDFNGVVVWQYTRKL